MSSGDSPCAGIELEPEPCTRVWASQTPPPRMNTQKRSIPSPIIHIMFLLLSLVLCVFVCRTGIRYMQRLCHLLELVFGDFTLGISPCHNIGKRFARSRDPAAV